MKDKKKFQKKLKDKEKEMSKLKGEVSTIKKASKGGKEDLLQ